MHSTRLPVKASKRTKSPPTRRGGGSYLNGKIAEKLAHKQGKGGVDNGENKSEGIWSKTGGQKEN